MSIEEITDISNLIEIINATDSPLLGFDVIETPSGVCYITRWGNWSITDSIGRLLMQPSETAHAALQRILQEYDPRLSVRFEFGVHDVRDSTVHHAHIHVRYQLSAMLDELRTSNTPSQWLLALHDPKVHAKPITLYRALSNEAAVEILPDKCVGWIDAANLMPSDMGSLLSKIVTEQGLENRRRISVDWKQRSNAVVDRGVKRLHLITFA